MKRLGKANVSVTTFVNDVRTTDTILYNRTIYTKADGTFWVNWFGGGHRQVTALGSAGYQLDVRVRMFPRTRLGLPISDSPKENES